MQVISNVPTSFPVLHFEHFSESDITFSVTRRRNKLEIYTELSRFVDGVRYALRRSSSKYGLGCTFQSRQLPSRLECPSESELDD